jgi:hypothetical protein
MPTHEDLRKAGRNNLTGAIRRHGGYPAVAGRLGLTIPYKPKGFWEDPTNAEGELLDYIKAQGTPGIMPTQLELRKAGQGHLDKIIQKHSGYPQVAARLGLALAYEKKLSGHWDDFDNVAREVLAFNEKHGHPGIMPTHEELRKAGRADLTMPIQKHGGVAQVASRLGLALPYTAQPPGYWDDFSNVKNAVLTFIEAHGTPGMMPTYTELLKQRRSDLIGPMRKHGGNAAVASRLGLMHTGRVRMTANTASSVERIARAIQPLAESNLLSGAHIMLILRRAGLLESRNRRLICLSLSLVRGDHNEIETAIAEIATASEEIGAEAITVESENLIAAEVEAQMSSGEEAGEGSTLAPLLPAPTVPDTQREHGVIRGLSALGELRLPLDEILSLVTCKILWEAFYKRLYVWYGSLDAAQNITAEDVEASILSAYPNHTDNEFVAAASALFAVEVEQAVNLATSLQNYGWHGPHLRLHQADAARSMAAVLGKQDFEHSFYSMLTTQVWGNPPHSSQLYVFPVFAVSSSSPLKPWLTIPGLASVVKSAGACRTPALCAVWTKPSLLHPLCSSLSSSFTTKNY